MKLFLSSMSISPSQAPDFIELVGKKAKDTTIALIENAADVETGDKAWVHENRKAMQSLGFGLQIVDLNDFRHEKREKLQRVLENVDAIWLGGGNTYYLRWILRDTGADELIKNLTKRGKVYGGGSAGAIMAGPTLKFFEAADDPKKAPEYMIDGLGLIGIVVVPHWQSEDYGAIIADVANELKRAGRSIVTITNDQAFVIDGNKERVIG